MDKCDGLNNGNYCKRNEGKELSQTGDEIKMNIHKDKMLWYNTSYCIRVSYERSWNIGKDLKGKELGKGITQESTGLYSARFVDWFGKRK